MSSALLLLIGTVLAGLFVGANIGANDAANCIGPSFGAGLVRYRTGIALVSVFVVVGAMLQGHSVADTLGSGIVAGALEPLDVLVAMLCGGGLVALATWRRLPVSTSQAVVGSVAGIGLAAQLGVQGGKLLHIGLSWVISPVLALVLTYVIYRGLLWLIGKVGDGRRVRATVQFGVLATSAYVAYSLGASHLGLTIGPLLALGDLPVPDRALSLLAALSIAAGALVFGRGVAETLGRSLIPLDAPGALAVQLASGLGVHFFSWLGVPVSTSQAIVGAIMGVGLYHGLRTVSRRKLVEIGVGWVAVPTLSAAVAWGVYLLMGLL